MSEKLWVKRKTGTQWYLCRRTTSIPDDKGNNPIIYILDDNTWVYARDADVLKNALPVELSDMDELIRSIQKIELLFNNLDKFVDRAPKYRTEEDDEGDEQTTLISSDYEKVQEAINTLTRVAHGMKEGVYNND